MNEKPTIYNIEDFRAAARRVHENTDSNPETIFVEAAGRDTIWGIGLGSKNPKARDPATWRGLNLLGFALTEVRQRIV